MYVGLSSSSMLLCSLNSIIMIFYLMQDSSLNTFLYNKLFPLEKNHLTQIRTLHLWTVKTVCYNSTFDFQESILLLSAVAFQECCICLCSYEDGAELHALPCNHHFHSSCIVKWLKMNATCPLCKYNILKGNEQV